MHYANFLVIPHLVNFVVVVTKETTWERPLGSLPLGPKPPSGPGLKGRINKYNEIDLAKREELRIQKEKEMKFIEMQNRDRKLKELIEMSKKSMNNIGGSSGTTITAATINGLSDNGGNNNGNITGIYGDDKHSKHHHHHHDKHLKNGPRNTSTSSSSGNNVEKIWKRIFAKYIPNIIKKYESEIGRDNVKGCAKELVNILTQSEIKHGNSLPSSSSSNGYSMELSDKKLKKIKEYSHGYMDKFLIKFNNSKKHKSTMGSKGSDNHKRKHNGDGDNGVKRSKV